jgi:hypothetical protein
VLVFTDQHEDWGWCLYETGFFDALMQIPNSEQSRKIYCLHNSSITPPSPIANLQTIKAELKDVTHWLEQVFAYTRQTRAKFLKDIPKLAERICNVFSNAGKSIYSAKSIEIKVDCSSLTSIDDLPEDTSIQGDLRLMEELFGTHSDKTDWKSVKDRFHGFPNSEKANLSVLKEISRAVHCVCKNKKVLPILGAIFVEEGPKRYRPVISTAYRLSTGSVICQVLLVDDAGGQLQNVDKHLGALLTNSSKNRGKD